MSSLLRGVFIVGAKRTAFGAFGGKLKDVGAIELGEIASRAALQAAKVEPGLLDSVVTGNVIQITSKAGPYISRHIALRLGAPTKVPCLTVNRLCGSGFQAVITAAQDICLRDSEIALAIGTESMSQTPFVVRDARFGVKFSQAPPLECALWSCLTDWHVNLPMGITAENLATKYNITREDADKLALRSQQRWAAANGKGFFKEEIVPVTIKAKGKQEAFEVDEHPRPNTTMESLGKLSAVFKKDGTVTAGNASGVTDGAAAIVLASEDAVKAHNLTPLARVVGYSVVGCDPAIMGIGPAPATRQLCERSGISLDKVDLVEVNEAFASQYLAVEKELGLDPAKTNVNGSGTSIGHPLAATGTRILTNLTYELHRRKAEYAVGSACIGGGSGVSVLIQRI